MKRILKNTERVLITSRVLIQFPIPSLTYGLNLLVIAKFWI